MKKILMLMGILCIFPLANAGKVGKRLAHMAHGALTHVFNHHYLPTQRFVCTEQERKKQQDLFKYDLGIEYHIHGDKECQRVPHRAILYLHPWGVLALPNKRHAQVMKYYEVLPGDIVTFNFPDGVWKGILPISRSSLGQISDVLPAIYVLNYVVDKYKLTAVDLFGYSRGAAAAVNMVAVLADTKGEYDAGLEHIGITQEQRKKLLSIIQNGSLVLNCPLIDANTTLNTYSKPVQFIAKNFTSYKEDGLQALASAGKLSGLKLKVLLHFQHDDRRVTNLKEADLYNAFAKHNPQTTYLVLGDDGGHVHSQESLAAAIHSFYQTIGASYHPSKLISYKAAHSNELQGVLLQPSVQESDKMIARFHAICKR